MPGLFGIINFHQSDIRLSNTYNSNIQETAGLKNNFQNSNIFPTRNSRKSGSYANDKVRIIYEGALLNHRGTPEKVACNLYTKYLSEGEQFVKHLRGSFQIIVIDDRGSITKYFLYSDHIASRQFFYARTNKSLLFSPDIELLFPYINIRSINEMAMVHFMVTGHFPSGHTAINEIKVLGPGEYLQIHSTKIHKKRYFSYEITPEEQMDAKEASEALDNLLGERIIDHWRNAESPAILLSGGYDSQYIFNTIAASVQDTTALTTVTWGQTPKKRFADMAIARGAANRFGTRHIEIVKTLDGWRTEYDDMFTAQNGMTDSSFYHAHELKVCKTLRDSYGIKSVIRGDECLGFGEEANSLQSALLPNQMSAPEKIHSLKKCLATEDQLFSQYTDFVNKLVQKYQCRSFDCLKDTLDFYERQHMNRNPLNYYKLHYLEVFCPLIDPDVLNLFSKFPSRFRRHKQLFKKLIEKKFKRQLEIACFTNLTDWKAVISSTRSMKDFFIEEFVHLPSIFSSDYFNTLTLSLESHKRSFLETNIKNIARPMIHFFHLKNLIGTFKNFLHQDIQHLYIPVQMLIIRAAVLSRWNKVWIKGASL